MKITEFYDRYHFISIEKAKLEPHDDLKELKLSREMNQLFADFLGTQLNILI